MSVQVRIPTVLRPRVGGQQAVAAEGATVAEVLAHIEAAHPGFGPMVVEADGSLKRFVNVFLGDEDVRYLQGLATPVPDGATLVILPAVAGGREVAAGTSTPTRRTRRPITWAPGRRSWSRWAAARLNGRSCW